MSEFDDESSLGRADFTVYGPGGTGIEVEETNVDELTITSRQAALNFLNASRQASKPAIRPYRKGDEVRIVGFPSKHIVTHTAKIDGTDFIFVKVKMSGKVRHIGFGSNEVRLMNPVGGKS